MIANVVVDPGMIEAAPGGGVDMEDGCNEEFAAVEIIVAFW